MDKQVRKTTLKDVARLCGVSPMTVSKMLNGKGGVSKETTKRIRQAIRRLDYTPNLIAKSLRVNKTRTLGVVASDSSELLFSKMLKGIIDEADAADYSVIIANTNQNHERENKAIRALLNKRIDGLLLAAPFRADAERLDEIRGFGIPAALVMRSSDLPVDFVCSDNFQGGYDITSYVIDKGFRDIHFFSLPRDHHNGEERRVGHRRAMLDHGLEYDEGRVGFFKPTIEAGYAAMRGAIADGVRSGTFICGCDVLAVGVIQAALDAGLDIPGKVRVCGYDDIEMLDYLHVPLTTMRQQVYAMGRESVRLLFDRLANPGADPVQRRLACELIVRKSTERFR